MAIYEFTQQFSVINPVGGTVYYSLLQSTPGIYIIKGMNCYSTTGIAPSFGGYSFRLLNVDSSTTPTISSYIYSTPTTAAANTMVPVFSPEKQVILTQPYLGYVAFVTGGVGTFYINTSYLFIPTSNTNSTKFSSHVDSISGAVVGAAFTGLSATVPTIIKSILVANIYNASATITLYLNGIAFQMAAVAAGDTYVLEIPIYLSNIQTLTVGSSAATTFQVVYSYTLG